MTLVRVVGAALLFLSLGASGPAFGQQEDHRQADKQKKKNEQQAKGKEQSRSGRQAPAPKPEGARREAAPPPPQRGREQGRAPQTAPPQHAQQDYARAVQRPYPHSVRTEQQARIWQEQRAWAVRDSWQAHSTWEQHRAQRWRFEHRTWTQRGGYGGFFVPVERFHLLFGSQRWFRLPTRPGIVGGYPRFWYGGYWWMIADPWPEFWSDTWYDTDDLFIDYSDGYYLYDRRHPGVGLAIAIVF